MTAKPNISPERMAELRSESQKLRPLLLEAEMPAARDQWRQWAHNLQFR